jgi:hypothetical protein
VTTNSQLLVPQSILHRSFVRRSIRYTSILLVALLVWKFSVIGYWPLAFILICLLELAGPWRSLRVHRLVQATPRLIAGFSASWMIALYPRALTQIGVAVAYLLWRAWLENHSERLAHRNLVIALATQAFAFEAIFLAAAIWDVPKIVLLTLVWVAAYSCTYHLLVQRQDRAAGLLAAAWALIATEVSWVCLAWLVSYTILQGYFIVPQPAIILTVMGYCFGSIYLAQRQNQLGRRRLAEYLIITLAIILIVVAGTTWKGSL